VHQKFSVHPSPEEFKNATISGHFAFMFEENSVSDYCDANAVVEMFSVHAKTKNRRLQSPPV